MTNNGIEARSHDRFETEAAREEGQEASPLEQLEGQDRLIYKLLHADVCTIDPEEVVAMATRSRRSVADIEALLGKIREEMFEREQSEIRIDDAINRITTIILYLNAQMKRDEGRLSSAPSQRLRLSLEATISSTRRIVAMRQKQLKKYEQVKRRHVRTASYKALAKILDTSVGNVGSLIARMRKKLTKDDATL